MHYFYINRYFKWQGTNASGKVWYNIKGITAIVFCIIIGLHSSVYAQVLVSTTPQNKNFLIEKGTGHVCGSCPGIERRCDSVLATHPGRGMMIEYHFGPDAVPQTPPLDYDFTTQYGDTISDPSGLNWPFYLNMMMNRRDRGAPYGSTFIFGSTNQVKEEADSIVTQPSPVNLYLSSTFNNATRLLTVNVQAYYTAASATTTNYLQLALTEDSIISTQYDADYPLNSHYDSTFVFNNVFRANLNGFSGDTVTNTSAGQLISRTYTYTIPTAYKNIPCNPAHCNLTLYVAEEKATSGMQSFTGKILTTAREKVGNGGITGVTNVASPTQLTVYPNPSTGMVYLDGISGNSSAQVLDITGRIIQQVTANNGQRIIMDLTGEASGLYFIRINTATGSQVHRIVLAR